MVAQNLFGQKEKLNHLSEHEGTGDGLVKTRCITKTGTGAQFQINSLKQL